MSFFRSPSRIATLLTWIIGGMIATGSGYVAYRLLTNPHASSWARWTSTIAAAFMALLFGYSLIDPNAWATALGAKLPSKGKASILGHLLALILLALLAVMSVWSLRRWIWP